MGRARLLGYDLIIRQVVILFEVTTHEHESSLSSSLSQWSKRIRDELLRIWQNCWVLLEPRKVTALLPFPEMGTSPAPEEEREGDNNIYSRVDQLMTPVPPPKDRGMNFPTYSSAILR